jgi:integrase
MELSFKCAQHNNLKKLPLTDRTEIVTTETVSRLIEAATHPRDKALIAMLYESSCRPHEILNLKICNVTIDHYGAVIFVNGKTGMRRLRLIDGRRDRSREEKT